MPLRNLGACLSPDNAWAFLQGIETLPLRMARHCENAQALAEWLTEQPGVEAVHYPGLSDHPQHALAKRQMRAFGGIVSFVAAGGLEGASAVLRRVRLFSLAESLGGVESLIEQPALMSYFELSTEEREAIGIRNNLVRYAVGIEDKRA